jgi:hypothetical protein
MASILALLASLYPLACDKHCQVVLGAPIAELLLRFNRFKKTYGPATLAAHARSAALMAALNFN